MNFGGTLRVNKFACFTLIFILFLIIYWSSGSSTYPNDKSDLINLKSLLKVAIHAAERGGKKVAEGKDIKSDVKSKGKTLEGANDPVTEWDYASHCAMFYGIQNAFPNLKIISEEHTVDEAKCKQQEPIDVDEVPVDHRAVNYLIDELVLARDVTIWIDPLDATQEYTEGLYQYVTTMVCVAIRGVPVIGVIHYPIPSRTYWGWDTKRTSGNIPNVPHREENKDQPRVTISRSHQGKVADIAKEVFGPKVTITPAGGAGYKVMGVVNGTFDAYFHTTAIKKWDICAGNAIIKTVNGKMTTAQGESIDYLPESGVKVTDGLLVTRYDHDYYLSKIKSVMPKVESGA